MKSRYLLAIPILISSLGANAEVSLDGTLGSSGALPGPDYLIGADLGRQLGSNLFHSFKDFNLNRSESATFSGPNSINNVISRVTGGNPSNIDGLIRSTIYNADMYLLNPYGIMFGENAKLDVQGSFHASTADYLRLGDGGRFDARNHRSSLLTVAPVEAFGFLTNSPSGISLVDSELSVYEGKTLSLIGGDLRMNGNPPYKNDEGSTTFDMSLKAPFGRINLASVTSEGEIMPTDLGLILSEKAQGGRITLNNTYISTNGEGGGAVYIRGGQFVLDNSRVRADTHGTIDGIGIDVQVDALIARHGGKLASNTYDAGRGGDIKIKVTGAVNISGENDAGSVSSIEIDNYAQTENAGSSGTNSQSETNNAGDSGSLVLEARELTLKDGAKISATTLGAGQSGNMNLKIAGNVLISGERRKSGIFLSSKSKADSAGNAGTLVLEAGELHLKNGAKINASTKGAGKGGIIGIKVSNEITLTGRANIASGTSGTGKGGGIVIDARQITLTDGAQIASSTIGPGEGGTIDIKEADTLTLSNSEILGNSKSVAGDAGDAGDIVIEARQITLTNGAKIACGTSGPGEGGRIIIKEADTLTLSNSSIFGNSKSVASDAGDALSIVIEARQMTLTDGAQITSSTFGPGEGGTIIITVADTLTASGKNEKVRTGIFGRSLSKNYNAGKAGNILVQANRINLIDGGVITTGTANATGGSITVTTPALLYLREGEITTSVKGGKGDGGNITIEPPTFVVMDDGKIIAQAVEGHGGNITIDSHQFVRTTDAENIVDASSKLGISGNVVITAPENDIAGSLIVLSANLLDVSGLLQKPCSAMSYEEYVNRSRLLVIPLAGSSLSPFDLKPSHLPRRSEKFTKVLKAGAKVMVCRAGAEAKNRKSTVSPEQLF